MLYQLLYKDLLLGTIQHIDSDFPNLSGRVSLINRGSDKNKLISDYVRYSIEANKLMNSDEKKWEAFIMVEEEKYTALIESNDWKLISEDGQTHHILVPNFCDNNEIIWRWNNGQVS